MKVKSKLGVAAICLVSPVLGFGRVPEGKCEMLSLEKQIRTNVGAVTSGLLEAVFDMSFVTAFEVWLEAANRKI